MLQRQLEECQKAVERLELELNVARSRDGAVTDDRSEQIITDVCNLKSKLFNVYEK